MNTEEITQALVARLREVLKEDVSSYEVALVSWVVTQLYLNQPTRKENNG